MGYVKMNTGEFESIQSNISDSLSRIDSYLGSINRSAWRTDKITDYDRIHPTNARGEEIADYSWRANVYNDALGDLRSNSYANATNTFSPVTTAMGDILDAVDAYENTPLELDNDPGVNIRDNQLGVYEVPLSPKDFKHNLSGGETGLGIGTGEGHIEPSFPPVPPPPGCSVNPDIPTPTIPTTTPTPFPTVPTPTPTGDIDGPDDPFPWIVTPTPTIPTMPVIPTGVVTPGDPTPDGPGGLIGQTVSLVGGLASEGGTGADMADVVTFGGASALMLGLTTPGGDANFLSNLAAGNDDRPLDGVGLDVFEHPDYTSEDGNNVGMMSQGGGGLTGDGSGDSELGDPNSLSSEFGLKSAGELDESEDGKGGSLGKGMATLAGAAAVGGAAAGIAVGIDAEQNGQFGESEDYVGSSKKSLNAMFFGVLEDEDEKKRKQQEIMERVSLVLLAASSASSFGTFILANLSVINPLWFLIAALFFGGSYVYTDIVRDKKYKRKQELEKEGKLVKATKPYFGISKDKKLVKTATKKEDEIKEPDWILLGMTLLSSSAFILKSFDVINWLIFLLLLILFILIIVVYIILKKKLGEEKE